MMATAAEVTNVARDVIRLMAAAGWSEEAILDYINQPQTAYDHAFEQDQIEDYGVVRIPAAMVRVEVRRLILQ